MSKIDDLYETIGGNQTVRAAIDSFYRKVLADEELRPFFAGTDMAHLRAGQSMFISMVLGGQKVYTGRDIGNAHAQARLQGLNATHFELFLHHFRAALNEVGVNAEKAEKAIKLLEGQRGPVLNP
jgi:hemoglobin